MGIYGCLFHLCYGIVIPNGQTAQLRRDGGPTLSSLLISGPMQAVEDRRKLEKHRGSKKLGRNLPGCPIPNLRRRTSVANHNTWNSNVDSGLYYGTNNGRTYGVKHKRQLGINTTYGYTSYPYGSN